MSCVSHFLLTSAAVAVADCVFVAAVPGTAWVASAASVPCVGSSAVTAAASMAVACGVAVGVDPNPNTVAAAVVVLPSNVLAMGRAPSSVDGTSDAVAVMARPAMVHWAQAVFDSRSFVVSTVSTPSTVAVIVVLHPCPGVPPL